MAVRAFLSWVAAVEVGGDALPNVRVNPFRIYRYCGAVHVPRGLVSAGLATSIPIPMQRSPVTVDDFVAPPPAPPGHKAAVAQLSSWHGLSTANAVEGYCGLSGWCGAGLESGL